jgi:hypothetical protein
MAAFFCSNRIFIYTEEKEEDEDLNLGRVFSQLTVSRAHAQGCERRHGGSKKAIVP